MAARARRKFSSITGSLMANWVLTKERTSR
jgi:hypothetical protein